VREKRGAGAGVITLCVHRISAPVQLSDAFRPPRRARFDRHWPRITARVLGAVPRTLTRRIGSHPRRRWRPSVGRSRPSMGTVVLPAASCRLPARPPPRRRRHQLSSEFRSSASERNRKRILVGIDFIRLPLAHPRLGFRRSVRQLPRSDRPLPRRVRAPRLASRLASAASSLSRSRRGFFGRRSRSPFRGRFRLQALFAPVWPATRPSASALALAAASALEALPRPGYARGFGFRGGRGSPPG
jgi:hypothetical protein